MITNSQDEPVERKRLSKTKFLIIIYALLLLALIEWDVDLTFYVLPSALLGFFVVALPLGSLVGAIFFLIKKKWRNLIFAGALFGVVALAFALSFVINQSKLKESQRRGDAIIRALAEFRADEGAYPERLEQLVPLYLDELPQPSVGFLNKQKFYYYRHPDKDAYLLGFHFVAWLRSEYYSPGSGKWEVND